MRIGILGSGLMGGKLGTIFARAGHEVVFSYSHSKAKLEKLARDAGGRASAGTPAQAAKDADALLLAVHWSRVDDLTVPFDRWRAALHRLARQRHVRVRTFLVPPSADGVDDPDQLVYVLWADSADPRCTTHVAPVGPGPHPRPPTRPVTDLAGYRAGRSGRTDR